METSNTYQKEDGTAMTGLDYIYYQLSEYSYNIDEQSIINLKQYVMDEHFDTESMGYDLDMNGTKGNIAASTSLSCINELTKIFTISQGMCI